MQSMAMQYLSILWKLYSQHWLKLTMPSAPGLLPSSSTNGHISHHVDGSAASVKEPIYSYSKGQNCAGRPTELKTSVIVTRPASGIPAAPRSKHRSDHDEQLLWKGKIRPSTWAQ